MQLIEAIDDSNRPISTRRNSSSLGQPRAEEEGDDADEPAGGDEGVSLEGDDRLGERQGDHVARTAEGEHGERAAGDVVGAEDHLEDERADEERPDGADDTDDEDRRRQALEPVAELGQLRRPPPGPARSRGSRAACTAWNMNNGIRASSTA